jgi:hypothetical protein
MRLNAANHRCPTGARCRLLPHPGSALGGIAQLTPAEMSLRRYSWPRRRAISISHPASLSGCSGAFPAASSVSAASNAAWQTDCASSGWGNQRAHCRKTTNRYRSAMSVKAALHCSGVLAPRAPTPGTLGVCGVPGCCRYRAPFRSLSLVAWCRRGSAGMVLARVSRRGRRAVPRSAAPAGGGSPS